MTNADAWLPIESAPDRPMAVLLHSAHRRFLSFPDDAEIVPDASRAETYDLGYWNGANWHYAMTNHDVFEEGAGRDTPTHWQPLPAPPRDGDGQEPQA